MKKKIIALILLLLIFSTLMRVFSIQLVQADDDDDDYGDGFRTGTPPLRGDVNYDGIVNRRDLAIVWIALRTYPGHSRWNPMADLNQDDMVNFRDLLIVYRNFGTRWVPGIGLEGEVWIGSVLPLSGGLDWYGENAQAAIELAVEEVNAFLGTHEAGWTLNIAIEDSTIDPVICLEKIIDLHEEQDIDFIIGPFTSAQAMVVLPHCDDSNILTISPSSTAPQLAIPNDYLFRFFPTDLYAGQAIGRMMYDEGKRYVIPVWNENDFWMNGLIDSVRQKFVEELSGVFLEAVTYNYETDFTTTAADLAENVSEAITSYGVDQVAVLHVSWDEVNDFMPACLAHVDGPEDLDDIKWYGSDGTVLNERMLSDYCVREFAMAVEYPCPQYVLPESVKYDNVRQYVVDRLGRDPDPMAYTAYDAVWAIAYSLMTVDSYDSVAAKSVLPSVVQNYYGASGWVMLDENGDRTVGEKGNFDFWQITDVPEPSWVRIAKYIYGTDSIEWY